MPTKEEIREELRTSPKYAKLRYWHRVSQIGASILIIAGLALIAFYSHPAVAGGLFLVLWGLSILKDYPGKLWEMFGENADDPEEEEKSA
jgi:hypothetical protein